MKRIIFVFVILSIVSPSIFAQIPRILSYQGILTDTTGKNPHADGSNQFTFKLYDSTTVIWQETKTLTVKNGLFSTSFGETKPFGPAVKFDKPYTLGIQVGTEPEMQPHIPLTSVGYSMNSLRSDTAKFAMSGLGDGVWTLSDTNIYRLHGNVGIGLNNPLDKLSILGENADGSYITNFNGNAISFFNLKDDSYIDKGDGNSIIFRVGGGWKSKQKSDMLPVMAITRDCNVGIGTISPSTKLEVNGTLRLSEPGGIYLTGAVAPAGIMGSLASFQTNASGLEFWCGGGAINLYSEKVALAYGGFGTVGNQQVTIGRFGNDEIPSGTLPNNVLLISRHSPTAPLATSWTTYSSKRWKTNVNTIIDALEKIKQLRGVSFDWKESGKHDIGLIAEEVGVIVPEIVNYEENGIDAKSLDYTRLVALLVEGMKEQQKEIDELKSILYSLIPEKKNNSRKFSSESK